MINMLSAAKAAKSQVACLNAQQKNAALQEMAKALLAHQQQILDANQADIEKAQSTISLS